MKILIACEHSGTMREAFRRLGHDCWSVDFKSAADKSPHHYPADVFEIATDHWDMLFAFPPCTYLCKAQQWRCNRDVSRHKKQVEAIAFIQKLWELPIKHMAIENPVGCIPRYWRQPNQIIYPWQFGDPYSKEICLWYRELPWLMGTLINPVRRSVKNHTNGRMSQGQKLEIKSSWKYYPLMAQAIAHQWTNYLE